MGDYLKYILEKEKNDKDIEKRKDMSTRRSRRKMSKSQRNKNKKYITDLTRQLRELDINPSHKRTFDHTRKSPKRTQLPNYDKYSSNEDLSRKRSYTFGGMEGDFDPKKWFEDVLFDSPVVFDEFTNFQASYGFLNPNEKRAVDKYLKDMDPEDHEKLMKELTYFNLQ